MTDERKHETAAPPTPDTPGRPDSSGSRQQKHPDQQAQTGSSELDSRSAGKHKPDRTEDVRGPK
jgi:hypothetical protein